MYGIQIHLYGGEEGDSLQRVCSGVLLRPVMAPQASLSTDCLHAELSLQPCPGSLPFSLSVPVSVLWGVPVI